MGSFVPSFISAGMRSESRTGVKSYFFAGGGACDSFSDLSWENISCSCLGIIPVDGSSVESAGAPSPEGFGGELRLGAAIA